MSVASLTEISATSGESFEDAIQQAIGRATKTLRGVEGAWVKDMNVLMQDGNIRGYKVNLAITFVLEEEAQGGMTSGGGTEAARAADTAPATGRGPSSGEPPA